MTQSIERFLCDSWAFLLWWPSNAAGKVRNYHIKTHMLWPCDTLRDDWDVVLFRSTGYSDK